MADAPKPPNPLEVQLQIHLDEEMANGRFINLALVNHTETEFILDFIYVQHQQPKAQVLSRLITTPKHLKRLFLALQDNLNKYESKYGPLELADPEGSFH